MEINLTYEEAIREINNYMLSCPSSEILNLLKVLYPKSYNIDFASSNNQKDIMISIEIME